jgi:hypothetical protein
MPSAYYSRNQSYSRSLGAEEAEKEGRFPRTRAAAALGLTVRAFDVACTAIGYYATEWHHVGKYANEVYYYDTEYLNENEEFWVAALAASSPAKRRKIQAGLYCAAARSRVEKFTAFANKIEAQMIPQSPSHGWKSRGNWRRLGEKMVRASGLWGAHDSTPLPPCGLALGDWAAMRAWAANEITARRGRIEERKLHAKAAQWAARKLAISLPLYQNGLIAKVYALVA